MRILMVHRYYAPDVPTYAQMLEIMARRFADEGHEVTVFTSQPSYNDVYDGPVLPRHEVRDGVAVRRVRLLPQRRSGVLAKANLLLFAARLTLHLLLRGRRYDLVTVTTIPPVVMGLAARLAGKLTGTRYLYHCMDLYPEVALATGLVSPGWFTRLLRRLDTGTCRDAAAVVVLSDDMRRTLVERGIEPARIDVINNFIIADHRPGELPPELRRPADRFQVLFAGNLGRFQGLDALVEAARLLRDHDDLRFVFMGAGHARHATEEAARGLPSGLVDFLAHQPLETAARVMGESDLAVISLRPGVYRAAYPSKTMMYLEAGCRLLAIVEPGSELGRFVREEDLGVVCEPDDPAGVAKAILDEASRVGGSDREATQALGRAHFGREVVLDRWVGLLADLAA